MVEKKDKKWYANKISEWFGFKGELKPDFSRMKEVDLALVYAKTELMKVASSEVGGEGGGGLFGFGILRGPLAQRIGNKEKRESLVKQVLDTIDADDVKKMEKEYGPLAKIAMVLMGNLVE